MLIGMVLNVKHVIKVNVILPLDYIEHNVKQDLGLIVHVEYVRKVYYLMIHLQLKNFQALVIH